jgi:hypothetical protein
MKRLYRLHGYDVRTIQYANMETKDSRPQGRLSLLLKEYFQIAIF